MQVLDPRQRMNVDIMFMLSEVELDDSLLQLFDNSVVMNYIESNNHYSYHYAYDNEVLAEFTFKLDNEMRVYKRQAYSIL